MTNHEIDEARKMKEQESTEMCDGIARNIMGWCRMEGRWDYLDEHGRRRTVLPGNTYCFNGEFRPDESHDDFQSALGRLTENQRHKMLAEVVFTKEAKVWESPAAMVLAASDRWLTAPLDQKCRALLAAVGEG